MCIDVRRAALWVALLCSDMYHWQGLLTCEELPNVFGSDVHFAVDISQTYGIVYRA